MFKNIDHILREKHAAKSHSFLSVCSNCLLFGEMAKANQRRPGGTPMASIPTLFRAFKNKRRLGHNNLPLSPFLSSSLRLSRRTKLSSVEDSQCSGRSSGKQCLNVSSKDVNKESLWHARSTGDLVYLKRWRTRAKECSINPFQD